jgi:hypothetical protein
VAWAGPARFGIPTGAMHTQCSSGEEGKDARRMSVRLPALLAGVWAGGAVKERCGRPRSKARPREAGNSLPRNNIWGRGGDETRPSSELGSARLPVPAGRCVVRRSKFADHEGHSSICRLSAAAGAGFWLRRPRRGIPSPQYQQAGGHHCASGLQLGRGVVSLSYQQRDGCQSEGACMPCRQRQRQAYVVHPLGEEKAARRMQRARACWRVYAAALHRSIPCLPACLPAFLPSNCPRDEEEEGMEADRTRHDRSKLLPPSRRAR